VDGRRESFSGAVELEKSSPGSEVRVLLVKNLYSYALGRSFTDADETTLSGIVAEAQKAGFTMKEVIHDIVTSEPFRTEPSTTQERT